MAMFEQVRQFTLPAVILEADWKAAEALQKLAQSQAPFGVVCDQKGQWLGIVTREQLQEAQRDVDLRQLTAAQPVITVEPEVTVESAAEMLAKDLVLHPALPGVIVQTQGHLQGVLPRRVLLERASRIVTRTFTDRLEGAPVDLLFFECPEDGERKLVAYYDPQNPPKCSQGHLMKPVED